MLTFASVDRRQRSCRAEDTLLVPGPREGIARHVGLVPSNRMSPSYCFGREGLLTSWLNGADHALHPLPPLARHSDLPRR